MSKPSSLYHYTSFDAIVHILDYEQECLKNGMMNFRFGNPLKTNDMKEVKFFEQFFFTNSDISNEIKEDYNRLSHLYILCLIHHEGTKWYPREEIPMWYMYGDFGKGIRITFDYKELETFCADKSYRLQKCTYFNNEEMRKEASRLRGLLKKDKSKSWESELKKIYAESLYYKTKDWEYENEYRIIVKENGTTLQEKNCCYVPLPLKCVREITIGPLADMMVVERCLNLIKEKLQDLLGKDVVHFDVNSSKLQIRKKNI